MQNLTQVFSIPKYSCQSFINESMQVPRTQNNPIRQNQPSKTPSSQSFQESINQLKIKMSQLQKIIKKKPQQTTRTMINNTKLPTQTCCQLRKTVPFPQIHDIISTSVNSDKALNHSKNLLLKAGQLIKKSNHLSQRIHMNKHHNLHVPKDKYNSILNTSSEIISSHQMSYSYSPSLKKTHGKPHLSDSSVSRSHQHVLKPQKTQNLEHQSTTLQSVSSYQKKTYETCKRELIKEDFQFLKLLGKGKFGEVHLGRHKQTGFLVAIKKVSKDDLIRFNMVQRFSEEIHLHSKLDHPNIVKFYGFYQQKQYICLVLQYLSGGTLFDFQNNKGTFSIKQATGFLREVISALTYLHDRRIAHRDLKPQNIVLSSTGMAKLCDFGWSTVVQSMRTTFCGTLDYASPEILQKKEYDWSIDVWCVGILTYQLLIGHAPFQSYDRQQVMQGIINIDKTGLPDLEMLPLEAQEFITALLQKDPKNRPIISQLLDFPLFTVDKKSKKSDI